MDRVRHRCHLLEFPFQAGNTLSSEGVGGSLTFAAGAGGVGGDVDIRGGQGIANPGSVFISSGRSEFLGNVFVGSPSGSSLFVGGSFDPSLLLMTGVGLSGESGEISITSGDSDFPTGQILLQSGSSLGQSSGSVFLATGDVVDGQAGDISVKIGRSHSQHGSEISFVGGEGMGGGDNLFSCWSCPGGSWRKSDITIWLNLRSQWGQWKCGAFHIIELVPQWRCFSSNWWDNLGLFRTIAFANW